ncbi:MAG: rRNA maturation RNase YbeY [bacterium]
MEGVEKLAQAIWQKEASKDAQLNIIFVNDSALVELNKQYLSRGHKTDVIAFPLSKATDTSFEGEIYISVERVVENAGEYGASVGMELKRVVVHGILHFLGYCDKTPEKRRLMSQREDYYLNLSNG